MIELVNLQEIIDSRGHLNIFEHFENIPMDVKRFYILSNLNDSERGFHAHKRLTQLVVCVAGSCVIRLDNGNEKADAELNSPSKGLIIHPMTWRELHNFSENCVLLVLADEVYDEDDYIRSYDDFKNYVVA